MKGFPILRVLGILLGGVSLVLLSPAALDVRFTDVFKNVLKGLDNQIDEWFQPLELAIAWVSHFVAGDFHPAKYWHHSFVLLWLLHGSMARNATRGWGDFLFVFIWGGVTALTASAMTGTVPPNSLGVIAWPGAGFLAFVAGLSGLDAWRGFHSWWRPTFNAVLCVFLVYLGYVWTHQIRSTHDANIEAPSLQLIELAGFVFVVGLIMFIMGMYVAARGRAPLDNPLTGVGLDILFAFGVASIFAAIGFIPMPG